MDNPTSTSVAEALAQRSVGELRGASDSAISVALQSLAALAAQVASTPIAHLTFIEPGVQRFIFSAGGAPADARLEATLLKRVATAATTVILEDAADPDCVQPTCFAAAFPITAQDGTVAGMLWVVDHQRRALRADQSVLLTSIAGHASALRSALRSVLRSAWSGGAAPEHVSAAAMQTQNEALKTLLYQQKAELDECMKLSQENFETAPDATLLIDAEGLIVRVNQRAVAVFGWPRSLMEGKPVEILIPESQRSSHIELRTAFWASAMQRSMGNHSRRLRGHRSDGTTFPAEISLAPVRTPQGRLIAATVRDISEQVAAEVALRAGLHLYRNTLDHMLEGAVILDENLRIGYANETAVKQFGLPRESLIGEALSVLFPSMMHRPVYGHLKRCLDEKVSEEWTEDFLLSDGVRRAFEFKAQPVPEGIFLLSMDVSERVFAEERAAAHHRAIEDERGLLAKRVEDATAELRESNLALERSRAEAEAANRAKSSFLAMMSHELRTPMSGVIGLIELLDLGVPENERRDLLRSIRESATSLLRIVDEILDFSKIEAGRLDIERVPVSISNVVDGVCDALLPLALAQRVGLSVFIDPTLPHAIWSDPTRLRQVLLNLLGNAVKFSGAGASSPHDGRVSLQIARARGERPRLEITVSDNGVGMSPEVLSKLFEPFFQAEASTTRRFGGTGLGLVNCRRLVDLMAGEISVQSEEGVGTTFTVSLPFEAAPWSAPDEVHDLRGLTCLVLACEHLVRDHLRTYLEAAGATVVYGEGAEDIAATRARAMGAVVLYEEGRSDELPGDRARVLEAAGSRIVLFSRECLRRPRLSHGTVTLGSVAVQRQALIQAVAIAASGTPSDLPATPSPLPPESSDRAEAPPCRGGTDAGYVLVAEDDPTSRKLIRRQIELVGYPVQVVHNGLEALREWRRGGCALLITDLQMPFMDGYTLARTIRAEEGEGARTPIVALTASTTNGEERRALEAGMQTYITKPVPLVDLRHVLARWIPEVSHAPRATPQERVQVGGPVLDLAVLRELVGDDEGSVDVLLTELLRTLRHERLSLQSMQAAHDHLGVGAIAHRLRSASRTVGAQMLADVCEHLESACRSDPASVAGFTVRVQIAMLELEYVLSDRLHRREKEKGEHEDPGRR